MLTCGSYLICMCSSIVFTLSYGCWLLCYFLSHLWVFVQIEHTLCYFCVSQMSNGYSADAVALWVHCAEWKDISDLSGSLLISAFRHRCTTTLFVSVQWISEEECHLLTMFCPFSLFLRTWCEQEHPVPPASIQSDSSAGDGCCAGVLCLWLPNAEHPVEERRRRDSKLVCVFLFL